jgi:hypothetical protein
MRVKPGANADWPNLPRYQAVQEFLTVIFSRFLAKVVHDHAAVKGHEASYFDIQISS